MGSEPGQAQLDLSQRKLINPLYIGKPLYGYFGPKKVNQIYK